MTLMTMMALIMKGHKLSYSESYLQCDIASLLEWFVWINLHILCVLEHIQRGNAISCLICSL